MVMSLWGVSVCALPHVNIADASPALTLALAYTFSQDNPNKRMSYFIVTFQAKFLPYAMLLLTFVLGGPQAALQQATGLVAAHLYDFLTRIWPTFGGGRNVISTPPMVKRWFGADRPGPRTRGYGTAFVARPAEQQTRQGTSSGWSSGFGMNSWGSRGPGRRLGGE